MQNTSSTTKDESPVQPNKKLVLWTGPPSCGKSKYINIFDNNISMCVTEQSSLMIKKANEFFCEKESNNK